MLLRGVNVGGQRKLPMKDWARHLEGLGFAEVETYLQSGQAVLTAADGEQPASLVRQGLADGFGIDTVVMARSAEQLEAVVAGCPWPEVAARTPKNVHACFVDEPVKASWHDLDPATWAPDEVRAADGVVYARFAAGAGRSKVPLLDRQLGTAGTSRNWNTVLWLTAHT
ncbi:MAG: hypothetical protein JWL64_300 [Frankiales bacterium]|nr:hypothetical protein [Frankiales bacterium]